MDEFLQQLQDAFPRQVRINPEKPYEQVEMRGNTTQASRVIISGTIVDVMRQFNRTSDKWSVWVNGRGSRKEVTQALALEFVQVQLEQVTV